MKTKIKELAVMLLAISIVISGCSKKQEKNEDKNMKIAVVTFVDHPSLNEAVRGFTEYMKEKKTDVKFLNLNANGDINLLSQMANKIKNEKYDLIYAVSTPVAQALKEVIKDTPIVFSCVTDPKGAGIVLNLKNPEENVTGVSDYVDPLFSIDMFLKIYPDAKKFGVIYNTSESNSLVQIEELESVIKNRGLNLIKVGINSVNDIVQAVNSISKKTDAYVAITDNLVASSCEALSIGLLEKNIPSISLEEGQVKGGLLLSNGLSYYEHGKHASKMAEEILNGKNIGEIPVEYEKNLKLLVNKTTLKALKFDENNEIFKDAEFVE